jgi:hypothetical protein
MLLFPKTFCDPVNTFLESFMLGHEWVDEIRIFFNYQLQTRCWSLGLEITVSYIGNTTLISEAKSEPGRLIH